MANYISYSRTNYFAVTDTEAFRALMSKVDCELWEKDGKFGIGDNGDSIMTYYDDNLEDDVEIFAELQKLLPDGEAAIFMEVGHENLRYLVGSGIIVTNKEIVSMSLHHMLLEKAAELTGNDGVTPCEY